MSTEKSYEVDDELIQPSRNDKIARMLVEPNIKLVNNSYKIPVPMKKDLLPFLFFCVFETSPFVLISKGPLFWRINFLNHTYIRIELGFISAFDLGYNSPRFYICLIHLVFW